MVEVGRRGFLIGAATVAAGEIATAATAREGGMDRTGGIVMGQQQDAMTAALTYLSQHGNEMINPLPHLEASQHQQLTDQVVTLLLGTHGQYNPSANSFGSDANYTDTVKELTAITTELIAAGIINPDVGAQFISLASAQGGAQDAIAKAKAAIKGAGIATTADVQSNSPQAPGITTVADIRPDSPGMEAAHRQTTELLAKMGVPIRSTDEWAHDRAPVGGRVPTK